MLCIQLALGVPPAQHARTANTANTVQRMAAPAECANDRLRGRTLFIDRGHAGPRMIIIQEVLSRPGETDKPLNEQEYWTLELLELIDGYLAGFVVKQACARWSQIDRKIMFDQIETERLPRLREAELFYEEKRIALMRTGFSHSDMDL